MKEYEERKPTTKASQRLERTDLALEPAARGPAHETGSRGANPGAAHGSGTSRSGARHLRELQLSSRILTILANEAARPANVNGSFVAHATTSTIRTASTP
jgi:hypothetical protein